MERARGAWLWWAAAAVLVALAAARFLGGGQEPAPVRVGGGATRAGAAGSPTRGSGGAGATAGAGQLYVHVAGRVRRAGLYKLAPGARVAEAIAQAGGPARRADLARVNLAARVEDGQQIVVPRIGAAAAGAVGASGDAAGAAAGAKLSLASATVEQLDGLDGIGPTLAKRIVEYRDKHGGFRSLGQLREVEGIGEKRFEALRAGLGP